MILLKKRTPNGASPVNSPVTPQVDTGRVSRALAAASVALMEAANAVAGKTGQSMGTIDRDSCNSRVFAPDAITVRDAINNFLVAKARAEKSDRYLRQLRVSLSNFAQDRANKAVSEVTLSEIEKWVYSLRAVRTMEGYLGDVKTLFNFLVKRGYLRSSSVTNVDLPNNSSRLEPPQIHKPGEVRALLETARHANLDVCRHLAIRYFGGSRSAETFRMREPNILPTGYIEVTAKIAKTRRRRLIKIQPVLAAWLALGGELRPLGATTVREVILLSGLKWSKNATRHSYCSYHLSKFGSAAKTAIEAGHTEAMLFGHYRECVTPEAAEEFYNIFPL